MSRAPGRRSGSLNVVDWVLGVCGVVAAFRAVVAQDRAPRPADPLPDDVVAARAKELQEKWARKGRYRAAVITLLASVITAGGALLAAAGATADEPAPRSAATRRARIAVGVGSRRGTLSSYGVSSYRESSYGERPIQRHAR